MRSGTPTPATMKGVESLRPEIGAALSFPTGDSVEELRGARMDEVAVGGVDVRVNDWVEGGSVWLTELNEVAAGGVAVNVDDCVGEDGVKLDPFPPKRM